MTVSTQHRMVLYTTTVVIFGTYLLTISPSIAGGDSGEIVAEGCILGTAHPPGYPLITMIINAIHRLAVLIDMDKHLTAYLVNIFSACCTSLAALCNGMIIIDLNTILFHSNGRMKATFVSMSLVTSSAVFGMAMLAFSPLIWQYAITAEVFALNNLFISFIALLTVRFSIFFSEKSSIRIALLGAFICGLSLCNQHTSILLIIPVIVYVLLLLRKKIKQKPFILVELGGIFLLGLSFYAYLPVAANLRRNYGSWGEVRTLRGFIRHLLRKDYGTFRLASDSYGRTPETFSQRTQAYIEDIFYIEGLYIVPVLALVGAILSIEYPFNRKIDTKKHLKKSGNGKETKGQASGTQTGPVNLNDEVKYTPLFLVILLLFYFIVFHSLANLPLSEKILFGVHKRFWMQPNILLFIIASIGYHYITEKVILNFLGNYIKNQTIVVAIMIAVTIVPVLLQHHSSSQVMDYSSNFHFKGLAEAILDNVPNHSQAVLLVDYDQFWSSG